MSRTSLKVELLSHTPHPDEVVATGARMCYSSAGVEDLIRGVAEKDQSKYLQRIVDMGHLSPIEHASFTFAVEGVSRALLAQITRHRIASYSVQSQRYVNLHQFRYVTPPEIEGDEDALAAFRAAMDAQAQQYQQLAQALAARHKAAFLAEGRDEKTAARMAEKKAIEDARFVLPNACDTKMIVTMNARSLNNFFRHRCCQRAQWEIRALADEMLRQACAVAPSLFAKSGPGCVAGPCPEGAMSCGKMAQMREKYEKLKGDARA